MILTAPADWATATGIHAPVTGKDLPATPAAAAPAAGVRPAIQVGRTTPAAETSVAEIEEALRQIRNFLHQSQRQLEFQVDSHSGHTVIRVLNPATGELIRQIPGDEVIRLAKQMVSHGGPPGSLGLLDDRA